MGSWLVQPVSSRFSVPVLASSFLFLIGVFSIRSVLRVASQNRIFASRVNRQFPAPDFNRLAALLPRRTAWHAY